MVPGRGFSADEIATFRSALLELVSRSDEIATEMTLYGAKHTVHGELVCRDGSRPRIVTVWIVETDTATPRLVTAYPDKVDR